MTRNDELRLVYSTDPAINRKCTQCRELVSECTCVADADPAIKFCAVIRVEKKGRGGKTVTVIDKLPRNEIFLKNLTTILKKKCGSGGTYFTDGACGVVEIQGDKSPMVRECLTKEGIKHKG